jgi:hypothetical protein
VADSGPECEGFHDVDIQKTMVEGFWRNGGVTAFLSEGKGLRPLDRQRRDWEATIFLPVISLELEARPG